MMHHRTAVLCLLSASLVCLLWPRAAAGAALRAPAPALLQEVAPWDGPWQHNWRDAHIASGPSRLLLGFTGDDLAPEAAAAGGGEQLGVTSTGRRQLTSALAAAKLSWGRSSLRLSPIAPTAAAHVLRRAAAFLDGGELVGPAGGAEQQAEVMLPVPVALPDGFTLESGTLQPDESGSGFAELFAKVPHKGSGVAAGAQRAGPDDADGRQQQPVQEGAAVLESGRLDAGGNGGAVDQKEPVAADKVGSSKDSGADDDGSLSAIPSAAVIEAQRLKQAAADRQAKEANAAPPAASAPSDGGSSADAVPLIPTDPTAPRMVPYVGSSSRGIPYSAGGVIISGAGGVSSFGGGLQHGDARSASLASLRDRASRLESGEQQSSGPRAALSSAELAGIVVGVVGGVGAGVALLLVLRARNARRQAAAVAAAAATKRKGARAAAAAPRAARCDSDGESEGDVEAAGAAAEARIGRQ